METNGRVYILVNPAMPGLVKIGHSTRPAEDRARELSQGSGIPSKFMVAYEEEFACYYREVEKEVHSKLEHRRLANDREFFEISLKDAIRALLQVAELYREREQAYRRESASASHRRAQSFRENQRPTVEPVPPGWGPDDDPPNVGRKENQSSGQRASGAQSTSSFAGRHASFKTVDRLTVTCSFCRKIYTVTFRRYETTSSCPRCMRVHPVDISWG